MFDRSEAQGVSAVRRMERQNQVARSAAEGRGQQGRLFLPTSFGEAKEVGRPPGRVPASQAQYEKNPTPDQATKSTISAKAIESPLSRFRIAGRTAAQKAAPLLTTIHVVLQSAPHA